MICSIDKSRVGELCIWTHNPFPQGLVTTACPIIPESALQMRFVVNSRQRVCGDGFQGGGKSPRLGWHEAPFERFRPADRCARTGYPVVELDDAFPRLRQQAATVAGMIATHFMALLRDAAINLL